VLFAEIAASTHVHSTCACLLIVHLMTITPTFTFAMLCTLQFKAYLEVIATSVVPRAVYQVNLSNDTRNEVRPMISCSTVRVSGVSLYSCCESTVLWAVLIARCCTICCASHSPLRALRSRSPTKKHRAALRTLLLQGDRCLRAVSRGGVHMQVHSHS
jgi:putative component of membrane protein insertase Oxa1/YidC/SpoIIIJ protein YidD